MKLSVILCTYNPRRTYLQRTLDALRSQTLPSGEWEFVLVDNNSQPPLASSLQLRGLPSARSIVETEPGFTPALIRGTSEATGDVCVLVHDDNILAPDYLETAQRLACDWPQLGAWGGQFTAEYEQRPDPHLAPFLKYLAVSQVKNDRWSNQLYDYDAAPAGAGMCVRSHVLRRWVEQSAGDPRRRELGRRAGGLTSCEDFDIAFTAIDLGLGMGVFQSLNVLHLIPARRVEREYLKRLVEGHAYSTVLLHAIRGHTAPPQNGWIARLRRWRYRRTLDPERRAIHDAWRRGELAGFVRLAQL